MKDRLRFIMKEENLSNSRLAEILEVQPSAVSHLLGGRNKPSFDMIVKIMRRFPQINSDWLLLGLGEPYRPESGVFKSAGTTDNNSLFSELNPTPTHVVAEAAQKAEHALKNTEKPSQNERQPRGSARPVRVVIFYDNGTCESFDAQSFAQQNMF